MRRPLPLVGVVAAAVALAGCGSTVQQRGDALVGAGGGAVSQDGLALDAGGDPLAPGEDGGDGLGAGGAGGAVASGAGGGAAGSAGPAGGPAGDAARGGGGGGGGAAGGGGPTWRGVSADSVEIGVMHLVNTGRAGEALGLGNLSTGDGKRQGTAIAEHLNKNGGLAGKQVKPSFYAFDPTRNAGNNELSYAEACNYWTDDTKVFAVVTYMVVSRSFLDCMAKKGVAVLTDGTFMDQRAVAANPALFYAPGTFTADRVYPGLFEALVRRGFLTPQSKVGLIWFDETNSTTFVNSVVKPKLASLGVQVVDEARVGQSDGGASNSNGNVVRFRGKGVDRVLSIGPNPIFFMTAAESQGYRPKYGFTSLDGPGALLQGQAPRAQLQGAMGIGWLQDYDVDAQRQTGPVNGGEVTCRQVMKGAGMEASAALERAAQVQLCDVFFFLDAALRTSGTFTPAGIKAGAAGLGDRYASPATPRTAFPGGRPDGAAAYRDVSFRDDCGCFAYTSGFQPI